MYMYVNLFPIFSFIVPLTHSPLSKAVSKPASPYQDPGDRISPSRSPLQIQQGLFSKMYPPGNVPGGSTFNPNAPSFIPMALQQIPPPHVSIDDICTNEDFISSIFCSIHVFLKASTA